MSSPARARLTVLHLDTERGWRGGQRQVLWTVQGLSRRGVRAILAARADAPLAERAMAAGLDVVPIDPRISEWGPWTVLRLRRLIRSAGVQIVHAQSGHTMALAALAAAGSAAKVIFARRVTSPLRPNRASLWKYHRADRIIAVCHAAVPGLVAAGIDPARVDIIPSGVDLTRRVTPATTDALAMLGIPAGAPLVVMVAAVTAMKDPLTFVRAVATARATVPAMHALLVGEGPLRPQVESLVRSLGLQQMFHLSGFRADADSLMRAADVVALSSNAQAEGIGGVVIDAISFGKPVAATAAGGIPEVIEDGIHGLLVPIGDSAALGNAIARLLCDRDLASRLGAAGLARAPEFSIERTVDRTLGVYERVVGVRS
ncbi:MAG TPA: glycosyltransferase family 4 protein [Gemmatimonadaceae bacterium]|nr:glycosyltransferase family 4 protein [Gemmatimonadaceae bacterium]